MDLCHKGLKFLPWEKKAAVKYLLLQNGLASYVDAFWACHIILLENCVTNKKAVWLGG